MPLDIDSLPPLLKPAQAAALLSVEVATLSTWRCRDPNRVPFVKVGGRAVRYRKADILRIIEGANASPADSARP